MLRRHSLNDHRIGLGPNPTQLLQILQVKQNAPAEPIGASSSELGYVRRRRPCVFAELRQKPESRRESGADDRRTVRVSFAISSPWSVLSVFLIYPAGLSNAAVAKREKPQVAGGPDDDG
jgi:hypothetical protein